MSEPYKKWPKISLCCDAPVAVVGSGEGTYFHLCTKCNKDCDVKSDEGLMVTQVDEEGRDNTPKYECKNCGRTSDVVDLKNCPFCRPSEPPKKEEPTCCKEMAKMKDEWWSAHADALYFRIDELKKENKELKNKMQPALFPESSPSLTKTPAKT